MTKAASWFRLALRAPKVLRRPSAAGEGQQVRLGCRADKFSAGVFLRARLKAEYRLLALVRAGSAKVRRVPESIFCWLSRHDVDRSVSKTGEFVVGKLLALSYNCGAALFKFEIFVLEPRQLILKKRLLALECKHCALCFDKTREKVCRGGCDLGCVTFGNQSFRDGLCACNGRDGELNFTEHGCPSCGMRVEEPMSELELFRDRLRYEPDTGKFFWRYTLPKARSIKAGDEAGTPDQGYVKIKLNGRRYAAHRIAWLLTYGEWPQQAIDHINGVRSDNRIANLRDVAPIVNSHNRRNANPKNTTGFLGVSVAGSKFMAVICVEGRRICLGRFDTPEEAHAAYLSAKTVVHHSTGCGRPTTRGEPKEAAHG